VEVLGVGHHHQEAHDDGDLADDHDVLDALVDRVAERLERQRQQVGEERRARRLLPRADPGVELRCPDPEQREDDQEDHAEHDPGRRRVGAVEARVPAHHGRLRPQADDPEDDQPEQDGDAEEVLEKAQDRAATDQRDGEVGVEQRPERLDDREREDDEAPEHEEVRDPGDVPLQQPRLAEHLDDLRHQALRPAVEPSG
jgi:hypothetical protein